MTRAPILGVRIDVVEVAEILERIDAACAGGYLIGNPLFAWRVLRDRHG